MKQDKILKILTAAVIIVLILVIWMLVRLNGIEKEITQNVLSSLPSLSWEEVQTPPATTPPQAKIDTAITFPVLSSDALKPQSPLTVIVENVLKTETDNKVALNIKVLTDQANSYTALNLNGLFMLIDIDNGIVVPPSQINGSFGSLPPRTTTTGQVIFDQISNPGKIILQIGPPDNPKFYEFDFNKNTYKETLIG